MPLLFLSRLCLFFFWINCYFLPLAPAADISTPKVICIGDSITAGRYYNWRWHLSKKLKQEGYSLQWIGSQKPTPVDYRGDFPSAHEGYYGATAAQVAQKIEKTVIQEKPDIALIHLGTNDISQKKSVHESAEIIGQIIDSLRLANPQVKIFLCLIPHPGGSEAFNRAITEMARARESKGSALMLVDLHQGWVTKPGGDTYDWVHPNLQGVLKISDRLYSAIQPVLPPPSSPKGATISQGKPKNLAIGQTASASAEAGGKASLALDADPMTMWAATPVFTQPLLPAEQLTPHWLQVDLGQIFPLTGVGIVWDLAGSSYDYRIETSLDGNNWLQQIETEKNSVISVALEPEKIPIHAEARFVRITITRVPNVNFPNYRTALPAAIREVEIYGKQ